MSDPSTELDELIALFERTHCHGNKAQRKAMFQPVADKIRQLESSLFSAGIPQGERLGLLLWYYGAAFGVDVTNGASAEQHMAWARSAIAAIRREIKASQDGDGL